MRILQRLTKVDEDIQSNKGGMNYWEKEANEYGEKLKQLDPTIKEEGMFTLRYVFVSVITCTLSGP